MFLISFFSVIQVSIQIQQQLQQQALAAVAKKTGATSLVINKGIPTAKLSTITGGQKTCLIKCQHTIYTVLFYQVTYEQK